MWCAPRALNPKSPISYALVPCACTWKPLRRVSDDLHGCGDIGSQWKFISCHSMLLFFFKIMYDECDPESKWGKTLGATGCAADDDNLNRTEYQRQELSFVWGIENGLVKQRVPFGRADGIARFTPSPSPSVLKCFFLFFLLWRYYSRSSVCHVWIHSNSTKELNLISKHRRSRIEIFTQLCLRTCPTAILLIMKT